ncbi:MAG TPA: SDR family NAD(P)-dependent oxidoreductase [Dehalococcoidia bacterium]|jgi:NAD(P)-dependent dehydrogenase (short-subunit alcohol dehydrogenase family)
MAQRLKDKVAVVTGASRGLGKYMALGMAAEGAAIVVAARTEQATHEILTGTIYDTAQQIEQAGGVALPLRCNVADPASIQSMVEAALMRFGRIDVLVNNAGVQPTGRMATVQPRHFELELKVNVLGPFWCTRAVQEQMQAQGGGSVINISSAAANREGLSGHYGVTKIALEWMTKAFAEELRDAGIACNALKPRGVIDTPGARFGRGGNAPQNADPKEDFVEASVILATATPAILTGDALFEHEVLARFGRGASLAA